VEPVGRVFTLKTSPDRLKAELVPSFGSVLDDWVGGVKRSDFSDSVYVLGATYLTPPLKMFIERVRDRLSVLEVVGSPLERGFGFGKTHALIFLWHLFTSDIYVHAGVSISGDIVKETLVLGVDCSRDAPLAVIVEELKAYADLRHPVARVKDTRLLEAVAEVLGEYEQELGTLLSDSEKLAELIAKILKRYSKLGGTPRLLLLVDELGWGLARKLRVYADKMREGKHQEAEKAYSEAIAVVNFLSYLYDKLQGKWVAGVVIWVVAEQDRREVDTIARMNVDNKLVYDKITGLLEYLNVIAERYSRGTAGISLAELSYSPEHALEIARYRILKVADGFNLQELQDRYMAWLESIAGQLNLSGALARHKDELRRFYPFSLGLIHLLKKVMRSNDVPATEFVRTVIGIAGEAVKNALHRDPEGTYTVGVKHLSIPGVVLAELMRDDARDRWFVVAGDIEQALSKASPEEREAAEITAKYILAKGVTADVLTLLELREPRDLERYGSTLEEIQLEILESFTESEAIQTIENLDKALESLRVKSARIEEREVDGKRYYLPSIIMRIHSILNDHINKEKKEVENKSNIPVYLWQSGTIPSLFTDVRVVISGRAGDVVVSLMDYSKVRNAWTLISTTEFRDAQREGKLLLAIVPPWDNVLFNEMYIQGRSYDSVVEEVAKRLQDATAQGEVRRPLHVVVLIPELSVPGVDALLNMVVEYVGAKKALMYLSEKEEEIVSKWLREYEEVSVKRRNLPTILSEEIKERESRIWRNIINREIMEVRNRAQTHLVRFSRDIAVSVLQLYRKAVYYSLDAGRFTAKDIAIGEEAVKRAESLVDAKKSDLKDYAAIVNKFLVDVVKGLAYEHNAENVAKAVLEHYREWFEEGNIGESYRIEDVVESAMLGTYKVKPLSLNVAHEAVVKHLNNQRIELDGRDVVISVNEGSGTIELRVEPRKAVEEAVHPPEPVTAETAPTETITVTATPELAVQHLSIELPPGFDVRDISQRLTTLINTLKDLEAEISSLELKLDTGRVSIQVKTEKLTPETLSDPDVKRALNFLGTMSGRSKVVSMNISLSKPVAGDSVRRVFGEYKLQGA